MDPLVHPNVGTCLTALIRRNIVQAMGGSKLDTSVRSGYWRNPHVLVNLRAEIDRLGLPRTVVARRLEMTEKSLSRWYNGNGQPRWGSIVKLAALVGRDPDWFYIDHSDEEQAA